VHQLLRQEVVMSLFIVLQGNTRTRSLTPPDGGLII
jgi:hypothetical protein